jgi:DNA-binding response OmpR family regulator
MQLQSIVRGETREPTGQHNPGILADHAGPFPADTTLEFGRFRILTRHRQLLADGVPVELGARAFDILMVLIDADGALVTKDELLRLARTDLALSEIAVAAGFSDQSHLARHFRQMLGTTPREFRWSQR